MKIFIPSEGPDFASEISPRFGTAPYYLLVDSEALSIEPLETPGSAGGAKGAGMRAVTLALERQVDAVLTCYISPTAEKYLVANGVRVIKNLEGAVSDIVQRFRREELPVKGKSPLSGRELVTASLIQTFRQFVFILPLILGLVGLLGLFNVFVSRRMLLTLFPGNSILDTLAGACLGSISAGNPINSYIIGGALLKRGVSLLGITAFMVAWVSVGLIQLPAEIGTLGVRFAILRNFLSFLAAIVIAFITVWCLHFFQGGVF